MRAIIFLGLTLLSFLPQKTILAQPNCEDLKKENEYLKKELKIITPTKAINSSNIDFNLLKCEGNTKEQTVDITLTLVNHEANQEFQFNEAKGIDLEGSEYNYSKILIGNNTYRNTLYTDVPLKTVISLKKVLPAVKMLKIVPVTFYHGAPGHTVTIEFKDLTINWK